MESENEQIRIQALKLLGYFLSRSVLKRKLDVMGPNNLFMLLCERLMKFSPLTIETYNALFEILVETPIENVRASGASALSTLKIENSMILKVISTIIIEGRKAGHPHHHPHHPAANDNRFPKSSGHAKFDQMADKKAAADKDQIKKLFINDLWKLLVNNRENRRLVLQMSVWQNWLINLIDDKNDQIIRDQILTIFRVLLYHAIKHEFGGWRVWIDSLAILHSKFSEIEHDEMIEKMRVVNSGGGGGSMANHKTVEQTNSDLNNAMNNNHHGESKANNKTALSSGDSIDEIDKGESGRKAAPGSESQICTISSSEVGAAAEETGDQGISTISSNENDQDKKEAAAAGGQEEPSAESGANLESSPPKDDTDVAATRSFRKSTTATKDFYSNLLLGGQQTKPNNGTAVEKKPQFSGIASTTPAFRIPEFKWSPLHLKLLNDLLYSIECDIQIWKNQGTKDLGGKEFDESAKVISATHLDQILQNPDNQIYVVNSIHLVSQLCDNIIIASGGLLPLLASATGGNNSNNSSNQSSINRGGEGLSSAQANSLLYRLVNLADILCFAATHINFSELENEKNMSPGGILEQCLRLVCTVAVKNCLIVQKHQEENGSDDVLTLESINQNNIHNLGMPLTSAAELLFGDYGGFSGANTACSGDEDSSSIDSEIHHSAGNTQSEVISHLSMHPSPIKDLSKLLQEMDVNRLRACIYRDADADAKQSQFLALATLYFISVLMVSFFWWFWWWEIVVKNKS